MHLTVFLNLLYVLILVCEVSAQPQEKALNVKGEDPAVDTLRCYLELRLNGADWMEYSKFITWPDEPGWDCNWVISKYAFGPSKKEGEKVIVSVRYARLGLFCYDFEFKPNPKAVTVDYELVKCSSGWKVNAPIPDYPDISGDVLLGSLRTSAGKANETPERRAKAEAAARGLEDALNRSRGSQ